MMSQTKHTLGDWKVGEEIVLGGDEMTEPEVLTIIEAEGYGIIGYAVTTPISDELKANAALIASAPTLQAHIDRLEAENAELLEALQDIASTDKTMVEVRGAEATINHIIGWAKTAIAKATGKD